MDLAGSRKVSYRVMEVLLYWVVVLDYASVGSKKTTSKNDEIIKKRLGRIIEHILPDEAYDQLNRSEKQG